ncbi:fluoride efflux transporter FluC [Microbacterium pygmaeum]|uniref:Fluoride-specific ion channel FluC n=1 Tax=Microbacterium pygmaeum TaxID=370764 RepID=A0A1G7U9C8_9MICO|nr:CrcB family protein [Microbacterium pygmaeum]SDG44186.1 camphor resistance protein CrcB [Microbacterium pygmaeum]
MPTRPAFRPAILGAVVLGGMLGVALREILLLPFTALSDQSTLARPLATMAVNVVGSFALGAVAGRLGTRHPLGRAFLGTGILGGFTTYSAFAVQSVTVFSAAPLVGIFLAVLSVLLGLAAAALGVRLTLRPFGGPDETPAGSGVTT